MVVDVQVNKRKKDSLFLFVFFLSLFQDPDHCIIFNHVCIIVTMTMNFL